MRDRLTRASQTAAALGACWLGIVGLGCGSNGETTDQSVPVSNGTAAAPPEPAPSADPSGRKAAPDFTLRDINGTQVSLRDYRGKVVLVNFWATWCGPCRREIPDFIELQEDKSGDVVILGISLDREGAMKVKPFAESMNINYPVLVDGQAAAQGFGRIDAIPTTFFVDRQGRIAQSVRGLATRAQIEQIMAPLIAEG